MRRYTLPALALVAALAAVAGLATAGDDPARDRNEGRCRIRIIDEDGDARTVEIDLAGLGESIREAMKSVSVALSDLDTIRVHRDGARRLIIREGEHEAIVDVEAIMRDVNESLAVALAEVGERGRESGEKARGIVRREVTLSGEKSARLEEQRESLRAEMAALRAEMEALRAELRRLRDER